MNTRLFSIVKDALLITLLIYTLIVSWNYGGLLAFISIIILGIVLGLLTTVYDMDSLEFSKQVAIHVGGSVLAILIVALINGWLVIDWGKVFSAILILAILAVLGFGGYMYYKNKKENPDQTAKASDFDNSFDETYDAHSDEIEFVEQEEEKHYDHDHYEKETPSAFGDYDGVDHTHDHEYTYTDEEEEKHHDTSDETEEVEYVETHDDKNLRADESLVDESDLEMAEADTNDLEEMESTYTYPEEDDLKNS